VSTCWPIEDGDEHQLQWSGEVTRRGKTAPCYGGSSGPEHNQNLILSGTFNQWSCRSRGVVCSDLLAEYSSRPAVFSTDCNLCSSVPDTPANVEQQKSSLVMTSAPSRVNRASGVSERRTLRMCRNAAKQITEPSSMRISSTLEPDVSITGEHNGINIRR